MKTSTLTVEAFVAAQLHQRNQNFSSLTRKNKALIPIVTVSMEPGSGGHLVAEGIARRLNVPLYDKSILVPIANTADVKEAALGFIEKERPTGLQDFIKALIDDDYVYTGDYERHLRHVIEVIGMLGRGVIVGRGANFILPPEKRFSIRVVAPLDIRIKNVAFRFGVPLAQARKRIKHREKRRRAFVRETFHRNIEAFKHYDLIINTARLDLDAAVETAMGTIIGSQANQVFTKANSFILRKGV